MTVLLAIVAGSLTIRLAFALGTDIFQDEAIYWWQSGEEIGFAPQPPVVALLAKLGIAAIGQSVIGLRAAGLVAGTFGIFAAWLLGRELGGPQAGLWSAGLFAVCPLFMAAGSVLTPDASLFICWLLFVWTSWRGFKTGRLGWWVAAGVIFAAGMYTKYIMALAGPSLGFALVLSRQGRATLRRPGPWLAGLVGAALFLPAFIAWDHAHGWAAISYHLKSRHHWVIDPSLLGDYVYGHAGAVTPVLLVALVWGIVRWAMLWRQGDVRGAWLVCFWLFPVAFFAVPSIFTEAITMRVHWDAAGYLIGLVALGCLLGGSDLAERVRRRWRRVTAVGLSLAGCTVVLVALVAVFPCAAVHAGMSRPPFRKLMGWQELAEKVRERERAWSGPKRFIVTESFSTALCIGFHLNRREGIYCLPHRRNRRYGMEESLHDWGIDWRSMIRDQMGRPALYVAPWHWSESGTARRLPPFVYQFFPAATPEDTAVLICGGKRLGYAGLFYCPKLDPSERVIQSAEGTSADDAEDD